MDVGQLTWRDQSVVPPRLTTIRAEAIEADSVGVMLRSGKAEGELILFKGGWADFTFWTGDRRDEAIQDAPGWDRPMTINEFGRQLDRLFSMVAAVG